jgi:hypothetical protein
VHQSNCSGSRYHLRCWSAGSFLDEWALTTASRPTRQDARYRTRCGNLPPLPSLMKQTLTCLSCGVLFWVQPLGSLVPPMAAVTRQASSLLTSVAGPLGMIPTADSLPTPSPILLLKGTVLLRTGQPCAGTSVWVVGAPRQLVMTNAQGVFELPVPTGVAVVLSIDYLGEGTSRVQVPLPLTKPLHVTLGQ